ncbi:MAG: N-acyl-D-amino acid deacylase, partial [Bacteroidetes bacterium]|nr:N-acyl-D-amino acid deacylase [Bacteroidota bacterium]
MKRFFFNLTLCGFLIFLSCEKPKTAFDLFAEQYTEVDFHLTGGKIIDGTGEPAMKADLLIKGDEIVFIGEVDSQRIKIGKTISAKGMVITPGFIDPHSHGDPLKTPEFTNFLTMGVTSISLGQDGFSPDYIDLNPWIKAVDSLKTGPNIIPFIGHGTLRELSGVGLKANPDENDILKMEEILRNGLEAGCWGMTTGLE